MTERHSHRTKRMKTTPTQRSLRALRDAGFMVAVTERWNPWSKTRQDLFGWMDLLALRGDETIGIQTTSGSNVAARLTKIQALPSAELWLSSPNRKLHVMGWAKRGPRGKAKRWTCRTIELRKDKSTGQWQMQEILP